MSKSKRKESWIDHDNNRFSQLMAQAAISGPSSEIENKIIGLKNPAQILSYFKKFECFSQEQCELFASKFFGMGASIEFIELINITSSIENHDISYLESQIFSMKDCDKKFEYLRYLADHPKVNADKIVDYFIEHNSAKVSSLISAKGLTDSSLQKLSTYFINTDNPQTIYYSAIAMKKAYPHFSVAPMGIALVSEPGLSIASAQKRMQMFIEHTGEDFDGQASFL